MSNRVNVDLDMNVQGFQEGMNQASQSMQQYETDTRKIQDSTVNLNKELRNAKREVQNLAAGFAKLDKEAKQSAFGREMARQLEEAKQKAAEYIDLQGDLQQELRNLASDTHTLDMMSEGLGIVGDSASAAYGMIAQFTGESEDAQRAIVMFTTATSALSAVTKIQNALQMQSNTMMAVSKVQTLAAAAAENIKTAATGKGVIATKAATVAQAAFNTVAYMNPYVLLAMAIVGVVTALATFCVFTGEAEDAQEDQNKAVERGKEIMNAYYNTYNEQLSKTLGNYTKLQVEWKNLKSEGEKNQWIKDNKDAFHDLGYEIDDTAAAETFFVDNEAEVIASFVSRAEAAALAAQQVETFNQALRDLPQVGDIMSAQWFDQNGLSTKGRLDKNKGFMRFEYKYEVNQEDLDKVREQRLADARKSATQLGELQLKAEQKAAKRAAETGVKTYNKTRERLKKTTSKGGGKSQEVIDVNSIQYAENQLKELQQQLNKIDITDLKAVKSLQEQIETAKKEVQRRKIVVGLEVQVNMTEGTAAWWDNKIKDLENQKKQLIEGSVEWFDVQDKIDALKTAQKTMTEGVTIQGNGNLKDALGGNFDKTIKGYQDAISALQTKLQETDWSTMGKDGAKSFQDYIDKIQEYKAALSGLQNIYDQEMLTPMEKATKHFEEVKEKAEETSNTLQSFSSIAGSLGNIFQQCGDETAAAMMTIVSATLDMVAQVIPQIMALVGAKQAEAMASGTASAAKLPYPANLGAIASIIATVLSTFATIWGAIKGAEGHAGGGIVGGSSYAGDKIITGLNSGEMVLNQRQQRNLFNMLDTDTMPQKGGSNVVVTGVIRGTDLLLVQKNTNKKLNKAGSAIHF